ncbi:response regulator transcription factor [Apibacter raozihei]|uniref:response regulator transcription factor n=1 Tax=Apibacter TaxID=1778601 RepID=UPI000FE43DBF|nr:MULTISPECIES: response regulator transcription factor [Apibacter]
MKILIIEDEDSLGTFMKKGLQQAGHSVTLIQEGTEGQKMAAMENFDLILLDLMLPGINGFDILSNLRTFQITTPVIITSALSSTQQVVQGLDLGAVDYIKKPFEWEELLARIRVVQKKISNQTSNNLVIQDLTIDVVGRKVFRAGKEIKLTAKEYILLEYLARNANRIVSKNQIMEHAWDLDFDPGSNIVEVHMYQLRKKIDKDFPNPLIETIVGLGYSLKGEKS